LLVTLNQPKSSLFAGNSDTLKGEPSESVVVLRGKTPRANRWVRYLSRNGVAYSKKAEDKTSAFLLVTRTGLEAYYQNAKNL
jgi:hypothetical protein